MPGRVTEGGLMECVGESVSAAYGGDGFFLSEADGSVTSIPLQLL